MLYALLLFFYFILVLNLVQHITLNIPFCFLKYIRIVILIRFMYDVKNKKYLYKYSKILNEKKIVES